MELPPIIKQLDEKLAGAPDNVLTTLLIVLGMVVLFVAIKGTPTMKAAVAAWVILP